MDCPPGSVGWLVPRYDEFESFTRIFHPITDLEGERTRWARLAQNSGTPWRSDTQFSELRSAVGTDSTSVDGMGSTCLSELAALVGLPGAQCSYGLWDGSSWVSHDDIEDDGGVGINEQSWLSAPFISGRLGRRYRMFSGRVGDLPNFGTSERFFVRRQPTMMWCNDGPMCLMSDPDYDSSIFASRELLQRTLIHNATELEIAQVFARTSLLEVFRRGVIG